MSNVAETGVPFIDTFEQAINTQITRGLSNVDQYVVFLSETLIVINLVLFGLYWALSDNENIPAELLRKILYIGFFALILSDFSYYMDILYKSFLHIGLEAGGASVSADNLKPSVVAQIGWDTGSWIFKKIGDLNSTYIKAWMNLWISLALFVSFFVVVASFFVLSLTLFAAFVEFKIITLLAFIFLPFAFFNKTSFIADKAINAVLASGIKLTVLALLIGIASSLFASFKIPESYELKIDTAGAIALGALTILALARSAQTIVFAFLAGSPNLSSSDIKKAVSGIRQAAIQPMPQQISRSQTAVNSASKINTQDSSVVRERTVFTNTNTDRSASSGSSRKKWARRARYMRRKPK